MAPMAYGNGTIERRGNDRWRITWYAAGKRRRKTVRGAITAARRELRQRVSEADQGGTIDHRKVKVLELLDDLLHDYRSKRQDIRTITGRVKNLRPFFGNLLAYKVGTDTVQAFVRRRQAQGVKDSTINRDISMLKRAFSLGYEHSPRKVATIPHLPMAGPESKPREGFFTHDEFLRLRSELPVEVAQLVTFLYYTGCRKGEAQGLRWDRVALGESVIRLVETKNKHPRMIPLNAELQAMLESLRMERDELWPDSPWVFSRRGVPIKDFRRVWRRACENTGIEGRLVHDLRRTGARNLIRSGVPEHAVMEIGGWRTRSMLYRYDVVDVTDLHHAMEALDRYLGSLEEGARNETSPEAVN